MALGACGLREGRTLRPGPESGGARAIFATSKWQIDPRHYLDLIEQRVGAFESARPILQWRARWPRSYEVLLQTLRQKRGENTGTREFVRILKLHRAHESPVVERAVEKALEHHCPATSRSAT